MLPAEITENGYAKLLSLFDSDFSLAEEKYLELRHKLTWLLGWWGARIPEDLVDETLARVARNLERGEEVRNLSSYCRGIAKNVFREHSRERRHDSIDADDFSEPHAKEPPQDHLDEIHHRLNCLEECLSTLTSESRYLITEYYCEDDAQIINRRRQLAEQLGLAREALANRAQRLRRKLEECITKCERKLLRYK